MFDQEATRKNPSVRCDQNNPCLMALIKLWFLSGLGLAWLLFHKRYKKKKVGLQYNQSGCCGA